MNREPNQPPSVAPPPAPVPKMLVIDDSELIHRMIRVRLQNENMEIHSARSFSKGIGLARRIDPDVILMDIELGMDETMDGFEALAELKSDAETRDAPVIFISASTETMDRVRALELGAIDFVCKPFEVVELKARVRSALRVRSLVRVLSKKARIDGLTGLWNRSYFDSRMQDEIAAAARHGRPLSLVICDLDHFKQLNDRHGHPFGDEVLERFAQLLGAGRPSDVCCRYGGEEFGVILPDTDQNQAMQAAERIRASIELERWPLNPELRVTASFGVVQYHVDLDAPGMVELADKALYQAKELGRNRVEFIAGSSRSRSVA